MITLNTIYNEDCLNGLKMIPNSYCNIVITSPPYNVNLGNNKYKKDGYLSHNDNMDYDDYFEWMQDVFTECFRVLTDDGRICVNIGDGKNGKIPTHADFIRIMTRIGFLPMSTIVWNKNNVANRCAWGSYMSAKSPSFPTPFEYIVILQKSNGLIRTGKTTITKDEWKVYANGLWSFAPETKQKKIGHPAMFPIELPTRLIKMLTFENDIIVDPFMGSGTTAVAALREKRYFIWFEKEKHYCDIAKRRIYEEQSQLKLF